MGGLNNKYGENKKTLSNDLVLFLVVTISSILVDVICYKYVLKILIWLIRHFFKKSNNNFISVIYIIIILIIVTIFLLWLRGIKNNYSKIGSKYRFILDFIFVMELFYLLSFVLFLIKYLFEFDLELIYYILDLFFVILIVFLICYLIFSIKKNIVQNNSWFFLLIFIFMFLLSILNIDCFQIITLTIIVINYFFTDIIYLYRQVYLKSPEKFYSKVNTKLTNEKIASSRIIINVLVIVLYIYLYFVYSFKPIILLGRMLGLYPVGAVITSGVNYFFLPSIKNVSIFDIIIGNFTSLLLLIIKMISLGGLRLFLLFIIVLMLRGILRKNLSGEKASVSKQLLKIIMENHIAITYSIKRENNKNKRKMKTVMHIDSYRCTRRMHKYKTCWLYKHKNIKSKFKKPNSN